MRVWDLFNSAAIGRYMENRNFGNEPLLLSKYFPAKKQSGLNISYFKGHNNLAIDLQPGALDAAIPIRNRQDLAKVETELPLFREEMPLYEVDRQKLLQARDFADKGSQEYVIARELLDQIFDDRYQLYRGALSAQEFMRAKLLTTMQVTIANASNIGSNVTYTYNFDPTGEWAMKNKRTAGTKWSDVTNADPLQDCDDMIAYAQTRGVIIKEIIMGAMAWKYFVKNEKIKRNMNGNNVANMVSYSNVAIKQYIEGYLGVKITVDNQTHKTTRGVEEFYFPQTGAVVFLGTQQVGYTMFGTTPEEADAKSVAGVDFTIVDTGVGIAVRTEMNPNLNRITRVSELVLPTMPNMDSVYVLNWDDTPAYTITFNANGGKGTVPDPVSVPQTKPVGSLIPPAFGADLKKAGKNFIGWNTAAAGTGTNITSTYVPTANVTAYAQYEA